jgi:hypothetical protein
MEVQRDGSLEKGSVDLISHPNANHNASVDTSHNNHNTIN